LQPAEDGSSEDEEFGLVRRTAEPFRQDIHGLTRFLQTIQEPGEMQARFHVGRLRLEQLAIRPDRLSRQWSSSEVGCVLKAPLCLRFDPEPVGSRQAAEECRTAVSVRLLGCNGAGDMRAVGYRLGAISHEL